ncbi:single-stranded DNA-binding protein [Luteimonas fraxinea]|uniref:Single-stranded DNA-binding protein n=1 Tax=Luteimonas fraxinea TaxID=2901869 RepID=A0ABS8UCB9_9GAMM|nr:single-stranded DNA-binding protein [Luteimonas fraxinea]MCD9096530.1 single-stranded DNA-binding protein [Luteimonas fraxinea]
MNTEVIVEVFEGDVDIRGGTFKNDQGEQVEYETRKQPARLESNGYAYPFDVRLEKGRAPFPPGRYVMDCGAMLSVNKGAHAISKFPILRAVKPVAKA